MLEIPLKIRFYHTENTAISLQKPFDEDYLGK
jgi:hypothetical protein